LFEFMLRPFLECLILVGIHAYLGLHVIRRRVIFVDLALAQIAALGTIVGGLLGLMDGTAPAMTYSLLFCMVGAALFAFTRVRHDRIPQEAVIGLVYAIAFSLAILVVQKTEGVEHMEGILVGNLLFVKWSDIIATAVVYTVIGAFHLVFWRKFLLISDFPEKAYRQGINVRLWDFLFYATFGFVITFSTRVAGVLLVFVFLVTPAILAVMITKRFGRQLLIGWTSGTVVTVVGLYLSAHPDIDLPSGPTVVAFYGVVLALSAVVVYVARARALGRALAHTGIGLVAVALIGLGLWGSGKLLVGLGDSEGHGHHHHGHAHALERRDHHEDHDGRADEPDRLEKAVASLEAATGGCVGKGKIRRYASLPDAQARLSFIQERLESSERKGLGFLLILLSDPDTPMFFRSEGADLLRKASGEDFGYDPELDPAGNAEALDKIRRHLKAIKRKEGEGPRGERRN